jgi:RNA polymerase sigma-70 factor (ECF subfamily)
MERMAGNDAAEVEKARSGDEGAFQALVERHSRTLFRLAYRMTGNEQDAEDVVQEALLKAYRRLDQFDNRSSFGSWLYRIAANCAYDTMRARARRDVPLEAVDAEAEEPVMERVASEDPAPDRLLISAEVKQRVNVAMSRLSERERAAFVLRHFEGFTTQEIGSALGLDTGAAKHSVFRAVRKLREALEPFVSREVREALR